MKYLHLISEIKLYNTDNEIITIFIEIIHIQTPVRPQYQAEGGQQYVVDRVVRGRPVTRGGGCTMNTVGRYK